jgi:predicted thioesterase
MPAFASGLCGERTITVTEDLTASHIGGGAHRVFSTPSMVALMERTCTELVQPYLPEGDTTAGVIVHLHHLHATPLGMRVTAKVELTGIDGRYLDFTAEIHDERRKVGEGTHRRAIIHTARFLEKMESESGSQPPR